MTNQEFSAPMADGRRAIWEMRSAFTPFHKADAWVCHAMGQRVTDSLFERGVARVQRKGIKS